MAALFAIAIASSLIVVSGGGLVGSAIANAQGQVDNSTSSLASSLTPEQKDAICNPNNPLSMLKSVNTTESHICGIPKTSSSNITTTETGTEAPSSPPSSAIPGLLMPEQPPSQPAQSESIQPPPSAKSIAPSEAAPKSIAPSEAAPKSIAPSEAAPKSIAPQIPPTG
jgi:hypothetical protein